MDKVIVSPRKFYTEVKTIFLLGSSGSPHHDLVRIHILLLRKLRLPKIIISEKNWEKALGKMYKKGRCTKFL